ncbi:thiolase domain-containing protein [Amycolatopsis pigmentata]|uniref:Thiolase domain-containing protein n=1 Tax=Amycolatopsis pigmentata TaxID=450801 RepID=A0ABW5G3C7_9PSEU
MTIKGRAFIAGAYEHPGRVITDRTTMEIFAEVAAGALEDAGLSREDVDGFLCAGDAPGFGGISTLEYLGLRDVRYIDTTEMGGASYITHVGHAAMAIAEGRCGVALIVLAGRPRSAPAEARPRSQGPEANFEQVFGPTNPSLYALAARRHMYEYGTTPEQLAAIKVAASTHAQYNPRAFLPRKVTVEEVLDSPVVSDPLHRLDCCVITDGGGALVVVSPEIAGNLERDCVKILGHGECAYHARDGRVDLTSTGAKWSGPRAFDEAGLRPHDVHYASIYDSFTITVLESLEDLGFCEKGAGGDFVLDGSLIAPHGRLPVNTDGGGLCNNHPANRGGMTKVIEAVRQLRGEANPEVQVPNCEIALAHGAGGSLGTRMASATVLLGRADA